MPFELDLRDLGRMAYAPALELQREAHAGVLAGGPPTLLLVEHEPVITVSARRGAGAHLLASPARLTALGIDVQPTDRGGDITYHGPGQLVAYPILRLADLGLSVGGYMRWLEAIVIETVAAFGVRGCREEGATGVWVDSPLREVTSGSPAWSLQRPRPSEPSEGRPLTSPDPTGKMAKLCALGVRVRRGVTLHGLALNVAPDLSHFATIVPCGLAGREVTSLARLLGEAAPAMAEVKAALVGRVRAHLESAAGHAAQGPAGRVCC